MPFSAQNLREIQEILIPYFRKNKLAERKRKDFELWEKAVQIIYNNKRKPALKWKKSDLLNLIHIQKLALKYKSAGRQTKPAKWISAAEALAQNLKNGV